MNAALPSFVRRLPVDRRLAALGRPLAAGRSSGASPRSPFARSEGSLRSLLACLRSHRSLLAARGSLRSPAERSSAEPSLASLARTPLARLAASLWSAARLACRRSRRSLLAGRYRSPLANPRRSRWSRLALAVRPSGGPPCGRAARSLRASFTSFAPVLASPSFPQKPAPCGVPPGMVFRAVDRGPEPGESMCLMNGILISIVPVEPANRFIFPAGDRSPWRSREGSCSRRAREPACGR